MPELRTAVMIVVEAWWEETGGAWQTASGRMEDKSPGGACIRFKQRIDVGTKIRIQARFENFAGVVRYCRNEGRDFVVGVQRDESLAITPPIAAASRKPDAHGGAAGLLPARSEGPAEARKTASVESALGQPIVGVTSAGQPRLENERPVRDWRQLSRRSASAPSGKKKKVIEIPKAEDSGKERKPMKRKWLDLAPWSNKQESQIGKESVVHAPKGGTGEAASETGDETMHPPVGPEKGAKGEKEKVMVNTTQSTEKSASREVPSFQVELLQVEEVFRVAGITSPRRGYSVGKVVEMINSEHMRGLSKEMKRAAVLMALEAAGVSVSDIQRDAKARQDALDSYEGSQRKQAEAEWAHKTEEITQIQSELESIKAHYTARISRYTESLARDKARFDNWVTIKQQESRSMAEAVELCLKAPAAESAPVANAAAASAGSSASIASPGATPAKPQ